MTRELNDGQGVDLPHTLAFGFHEDLFQQDFILHTIREISFPPFALCQHLGELLTGKSTRPANDACFAQLLADPQRTEWQSFLIARVTCSFTNKTCPGICGRDRKSITCRDGQHPLAPLCHVVCIGDLDVIFKFGVNGLIGKFRLHLLEIRQRLTIASQNHFQ
ncbi:hypothetical protein D3C71_1621250 [compost metagenome]